MRGRTLSWLALLLSTCVFVVACDEDKTATQEDVAQDTTAEDTSTAETVEDMVDEEAPVCGSFNFCLDEFGRPASRLCDENQRCNKISDEVGCCEEVFSCTDDASCEANRDEHRDCPDTNVACVCDVPTGACQPFLCSGDADCDEGEICADGGCMAAPTEGLVARFATPPRDLAVGEAFAVELVAVDPENPSVVVREGVSFDVSSSADAVATVAVTGHEATLTAASVGAVTFTATVAGNGSDPGDTLALNVVEAPSAAALSVYVVDESTQTAVGDGVTVWVTDADGSTTSATTTGGWATWDTAPVYPVEVSVFDEAYTYATLLGVEAEEGETPALLLPVTPATRAQIEQDDQTGELTYDLMNVGAVRGTPDFSNVTVRGEVEVCLTGLSLSNSLFELDLNLIIGPEVSQFLPDSSPINVDEKVGIPSGVTLGFSGSPIVEDYNAVGLPPTRSLWSVGGRVSLFENPNLFEDVADNLQSQDIASVVAVILPFFRDFYSGVVRDVAIDAEQVVDVNTVLLLPTQLRTEVPITEVPMAGEQALDLALVIGGALVPGQGFLPLGIAAGVGHEDEEGVPTGLFDGDPSTPERDPIGLSMAPLHSGLETDGRYGVVIAALSSDDSQGVRTTGLVARRAPGEGLEATTTLPRAELPALPVDSSYDGASRTVTVTLAEGETPGVVRVILQSSSGDRWVVFAPADTTSIVLPDPNAIAGVADRADNDVSLSTLGTMEGADFGTLVRFHGPRLSELIDIVNDFTVFQLR